MLVCLHTDFLTVGVAHGNLFLVCFGHCHVFVGGAVHVRCIVILLRSIVLSCSVELIDNSRVAGGSGSGSDLLWVVPFVEA